MNKLHSSPSRGLVLGLTLVAAGLVNSRAAAPDVSKLPPAASRKVDFDKDIKPIFDKSCVGCHGPEKQKAKLRLDSKADAIKQTETGDAVLPGKSEKSKLVHLIARLDPGEAMPPKGKGDPLTAEQVGLVRAWIDQGAK